MARIRPIPKDRAAMILRPLYDMAERQFGSVPNLFQTMAHRPELLLTFSNFYKELWTGGVVDAKTKELAALRTAVLNGCHY
ncbi:MAG: carboxymuconolactone decarboxylase family protein [Terriglobia bacterium]